MTTEDKPKLTQIVTELRESKSKYDLVMKGRTIRFQIVPHHDGIAAQFVSEIKLKAMVPQFIQHMLGPGPEDEIVHHEIVCVRCFHYRWYDKIIGRTIEIQLERWAKKQHEEFKQMMVNDDRAEQLRTKIG